MANPASIITQLHKLFQREGLASSTSQGPSNLEVDNLRQQALFNLIHLEDLRPHCELVFHCLALSPWRIGLRESIALFVAPSISMDSSSLELCPANPGLISRTSGNCAKPGGKQHPSASWTACRCGSRSCNGSRTRP